MQNYPSGIRLRSQEQTVRCPWQIIKTKTAADSKKKILIHMVLFQQERDQNKLVKHQSKSNLESVQPNTGAI